MDEIIQRMIKMAKIVIKIVEILVKIAQKHENTFEIAQEDVQIVLKIFELSSKWFKI